MGVKFGGIYLPLPVLLGIFAFAFWSAKKLFFTKRKLPLPPGPKGLPILGNIRDLPPPGVAEWQHWIKHRDLYGPISSVTALGMTIILIHDRDIAIELLEKRSSKYSSRPSMVFANEMCGYNELVGFQDNNQFFRDQRRLIAGQIGSKSSMSKFYSAIEFQVGHFLLRTRDNTKDLASNLQAEAAALMLETVYGYTPSSLRPDPLIELVNKFMLEFGEAAVPGTWLVDVIPQLRYLPDWVPGTGFKKIARQYKQTFADVVHVPHEFTERQVENGSAKPSFLSGLLKQTPSAEERHAIKFSASALYDGGADTTVAALESFFVAMTVFPEVQTKAREEIDRVVGSGRLPSFADREHLPYIDAMVKETLRWQPIGPLGLPHATDDDDEFRGYRIPKKSIIIPAIAWYSKDPDVYHEPEKFKPERFLGPNPEPTPWSFIFGFGRRICPGKHLADANIFLLLAQTMATLDIQKAVDKDTGKIIEPELGSLPGVVAHPKPYQCRITPRSEKHAELINNLEAEYPFEDGDAKLLRGALSGGDAF